MQTQYKFLTVLALAGIVLFTQGRMAAQPNSKPATVTLIAVMPERLSLGVNPKAILSSSLALNSSPGTETAASITTSWSLLPGRAQVVIWAHVVDSSPVLLASAMDLGGNPFADGSAGFPGYRIPASNPTLHLKIDSTNLTQPGRTSTNTVDLPLEINEIPAPLLPQDPAAGTVKIQVQALP
jgi:hypothetical protein